jgi:hypothetical protein
MHVSVELYVNENKLHIIKTIKMHERESNK